MKKVKTSLLVAMAAVSAAALASCGPKQTGDVNLTFWSSFGQTYTNVLNDIVARAQDSISSDEKKIDILHISQKGYDQVKTKMMSAIKNLSYPNMVTGYPDHFAEYAGNYILHPLDDLVKEYDQKHGTNLLDDYFAQYMEENYAIDCDENGNKVLTALPFNKSTELMGYNGVFVDYCASLEEYKAYNLDVVPNTWQEWAEKGVYYRQILDSLVGVTGNYKGKAVYGVQNYEGKASEFSVHARDELKDAEGNWIEQGTGKKCLLDFTDVDKGSSRIISWDSTDNMFITLVRQWGAEYTFLPQTEMTKMPLYRQGQIRFYSAENKPKVANCMRFFNRMNKKGIFGVPAEFQGASYSSEAFEKNQVMFMLCSSGGLSYNTAKWTNRFRVHTLPYNADLPDCKYVISQGADITLTDATEDYSEAFEAMVAMTTGELQADWCLATGYYPCSKSATNSPKYQKFLKQATPEGIQEYMEEAQCTEEEALAHAYESPTNVAYREGSQVNANEYMDDSKGWHKFVDAAFKSSADIRTLCKGIFESVFAKILDPEVGDETYTNILKSVVENPTISQNTVNILVVK